MVEWRGRPWIYAALLSFLVATVQAREPVLTVGIVPQRSALALALAWTPLLRAVGHAARCHLHFETAKDIPTFTARVLAGRYDVAYMNPYQYVLAHQRRGYRAFLADAGRLRSAIVVARTSPLRSLWALAHRMVAFPAPESLAASLLPQAFLARLGIPIHPVYVASHGSVYRDVAVGLYPAGGGIVRTLRHFPPTVRRRLRVLWVGPPLPSHPFAALPSLPQALVARLRSAFVALARGAAGRALLAPVGVRAFVSADDRDYDPIRALFPAPLGPRG